MVESILPRYDYFDSAHRRDHATKVIRESLRLCRRFPEADPQMAYVIAAFHDTGLCEGREQHHLVSGRIIRQDSHLSQWFTPSQIEVMAQAAEDHRASADHPPRSIYGCIVAEADRDINPKTIIRRTLQYGLSHYPQLSPEEHIARAMQHLDEKYGPNGYLRLWIPGSRNEQRLHKLWQLMEDRPAMERRLKRTLHFFTG